MNRYCKCLVMSMLMVLLLTGCGKKLSEDDKEQLIADNLNYIYIDYKDGYSCVLDLNTINAIEESSEKDCLRGTYEVVLSNDCYEKKGEYEFEFVCGSDNQWYVNYYYPLSESLRLIAFPEYLDPESTIESKYMIEDDYNLHSNRTIGFDYVDINNSGEIIEYSNGAGFIYSVSGDAYLASMDGTVEYDVILEKEDDVFYKLDTFIDDENANITWKDTLFGEYKEPTSFLPESIYFVVNGIEETEDGINLSITDKRKVNDYAGRTEFTYDDEKIKMHAISKGGYADNSSDIDNYGYANYVLTYGGLFAKDAVSFSGAEEFYLLEKVKDLGSNSVEVSQKANEEKEEKNEENYEEKEDENEENLPDWVLESTVLVPDDDRYYFGSLIGTVDYSYTPCIEQVDEVDGYLIVSGILSVGESDTGNFSDGVDWGYCSYRIPIDSSCEFYAGGGNGAPENLTLDEFVEMASYYSGLALILQIEDGSLVGGWIKS